MQLANSSHPKTASLINRCCVSLRRHRRSWLAVTSLVYRVCVFRPWALVMSNHSQGDIRTIGSQMMQCLHFLSAMGLTHTETWPSRMPQGCLFHLRNLYAKLLKDIAWKWKKLDMLSLTP